MLQSPLDEFLAHELNSHVRSQLLAAIEEKTAGQRYFTYNAFNVLIDVEKSTATVEDELDVSRQSVIPLREFKALLVRGVEPWCDGSSGSSPT